MGVFFDDNFHVYSSSKSNDFNLGETLDNQALTFDLRIQLENSDAFLRDVKVLGNKLLVELSKTPEILALITKWFRAFSVKRRHEFSYQSLIFAL